MVQPLQEVQTGMGATFKSVAGVSIPDSFSHDALALKAVQTGVALCDRSHWGSILVTGADRIRYLHNQSTNDFNRLQAGQGCDTVFVTSTARTLDLATAYVLADSVLLLVSPQRREKLLGWLDRYIFGADQVTLQDLTATTAIFSLIGPTSSAIVEQLGGGEIINQPSGTHTVVNCGSAAVRIAIGSGLASPGYTLMLETAQAATLWSQLVEWGAVPLGDRLWERLRIEQGRPAPDQELTEDYNPLEAGLWHTISFAKGCYIGQETIARLNTYQGVKQQLWGIRLSQHAEPGTVITLDGEKVGILTSITELEQGYAGLGYIRTKAGGAGLTVQIEAQTAEVIEVPFLTRVPPQ